jgi:Family of unknown function (DUF6370)
MIKVCLVFLTCSFFVFSASSQQKETKQQHPDSTKKIQVVEAACGECQLGLEGNSCDLAVRIDGKSYFVDGTNIDSHGDAHAKDGFCKMIRKAEVQGSIVANRFKVTYFRLLEHQVRPGKTD